MKSKRGWVLTSVSLSKHPSYFPTLLSNFTNCRMNFSPRFQSGFGHGDLEWKDRYPYHWTESLRRYNVSTCKLFWSRLRDTDKFEQDFFRLQSLHQNWHHIMMITRVDRCNMDMPEKPYFSALDWNNKYSVRFVFLCNNLIFWMILHNIGYNTECDPHISVWSYLFTGSLSATWGDKYQST